MIKRLIVINKAIHDITRFIIQIYVGTSGGLVLYAMFMLGRGVKNISTGGVSSIPPILAFIQFVWFIVGIFIIYLVTVLVNSIVRFKQCGLIHKK